MKIGDILTCYRPCGNFVVNEKYKVTILENNNIRIKSIVYDYLFSLDETSHIYYRNWFSNIKNERLNKLNKLDSI